MFRSENADTKPSLKDVRCVWQCTSFTRGQRRFETGFGVGSCEVESSFFSVSHCDMLNFFTSLLIGIGARHMYEFLDGRVLRFAQEKLSELGCRAVPESALGGGVRTFIFLIRQQFSSLGNELMKDSVCGTNSPFSQKACSHQNSTSRCPSIAQKCDAGMD